MYFLRIRMALSSANLFSRIFTRRWPNVVLILGRRRRRWANIKTILCQCLMWLWYEYYNIIMIIIIIFLVKIKSVWTMSPQFHWFEADVYYYCTSDIIHARLFLWKRTRCALYLLYPELYPQCTFIRTIAPSVECLYNHDNIPLSWPPYHYTVISVLRVIS